MKPCLPFRLSFAVAVGAAAIGGFALALRASADPEGRAERADWPQWRGPRRNGISSETGWLTTWPKGGPKRLWKASVGVGYSSVAVSRGRVYTMGNRKGIDTVYCLNADTGKEIWKRTYPCKPGTHAGTRATPTVHGDRVYTFSREGHLYCFEAGSGKIVWSKNVQKLLRREPLKWGMSSSPLIEKNLVILSAGSCAVAVDKVDGKIVWRAESEMPSYASPVAFGANGRRRLLVMAGKEMVCLKAADGKVLWRHPWRPEYPNNCSDPIVTGDRIFISSGYGQGCALLQMGRSKPTVLWQNKKLKTHVNSCVLWRGHVFGFDGDIRGKVWLRCLDLEGGKVKWSEPIKGSLILVDGKLIIQSTDGELIIAAAAPTGFKALARTKALEGTCWTPPVLAGGRIYCRSHEGDLVCLDVRAR